MKRVWFFTVALVPAMACGWLAHAVSAPSQAASEKPLIHVVLITLKKDAPANAADDIIRDARERLSKIEVVKHIHAGRRAPGDRDIHVKDYDVALDIHLEKAGDVPAYLKDPLHEQFVAAHTPHVERLRVCDFYSE